MEQEKIHFWVKISPLSPKINFRLQNQYGIEQTKIINEAMKYVLWKEKWWKKRSELKNGILAWKSEWSCDTSDRKFYMEQEKIFYWGTKSENKSKINFRTLMIKSSWHFKKYTLKKFSSNKEKNKLAILHFNRSEKKKNKNVFKLSMFITKLNFLLSIMFHV
jgi:hypothetical protein